MADNEQIRQQNEINRATGQGHDAVRRETAGMIKKLRKALEKQVFHKLDDGSLCFCEHRNPASLHEEHAEHCQLARKALAESKPQQQDFAWCCPQCHGKSYIIVNGVEVCGVCKPNEAPEAWAEGNAMLKKIGEPTADRNAGMVEKLRKALEPFATFAESNVDADGWNDVGIGTSHDRIVDWFGPSDFRQARALLAENEAGVDTFVLPVPAHETILTSTGAEQVRPTSFVPTECPIPPTTPEEVNDILASVGLPPRPLSPPEIAREIVAKSMLWNPVVDNVLGDMSLAAYASIKRKGLEDRIAAAIEKERERAKRMK